MENQGVCIWCKRVIDEISVEHIVPEPLGCPPAFARDDIVCRSCNNGLGHVDQGLVRDLGTIAFMKGMTGKKGKPPTISGWSALRGQSEADGPEMFINAGPGDVDSPAGKLKPAHKSNGIFDVNMTTDGDRTRVHFKQHIGGHPHFIRALYKIGLGLCAHFLGKKFALRPEFDPVRAFVMRGEGSFQTVLTSAKSADANYFARPVFPTSSGLPCFKFGLLGLEALVDLDPAQRGLNNIVAMAMISAERIDFTVLPLEKSDVHDHPLK